MCVLVDGGMGEGEGEGREREGEREREREEHLVTIYLLVLSIPVCKLWPVQFGSEARSCALVHQLPLTS